MKNIKRHVSIKPCWTVGYFGCISISEFASLVYVPAGITSSRIGIKKLMPSLLASKVIIQL